MDTEYLSVLPSPSPAQLEALLQAEAVQHSGARVTVQQGQDATLQQRTRLTVQHAEEKRVAATRDALLAEGRRLGLRIFLI
ncbi:hypothetical protein [Deinococcus sonorensis]|uniref:Uncharacterized protein n=2 Tax=Deinococcus sonorensis TaxID=309891 RepID=A0AAU7UBN9_9DEIO